MELQKYSLDAMLANSDQKILAQDVKSDMDKVLSKMKKARGKSERFHLGKDFLIWTELLCLTSHMRRTF